MGLALPSGHAAVQQQSEPQHIAAKAQACEHVCRGEKQHGTPALPQTHSLCQGWSGGHCILRNMASTGMDRNSWTAGVQFISSGAHQLRSRCLSPASWVSMPISSPATSNGTLELISTCRQTSWYQRKLCFAWHSGPASGACLLTARGCVSRLSECCVLLRVYYAGMAALGSCGPPQPHQLCLCLCPTRAWQH
jgi:hypothetical protein